MFNYDEFIPALSAGKIGEAYVAKYMESVGYKLMPYNREDEKKHIDRVALDTYIYGHFSYDAKFEDGIARYGNIAFEVEPNPTKTGKAAMPWGIDPDNEAGYIFVVDKNQAGYEKPQMWVFQLADLQHYWRTHPNTPVKKRCACIPLKDMEKYGYYYFDNNWNWHWYGDDDVWYIGQIRHEYDKKVH